MSRWMHHIHSYSNFGGTLASFSQSMIYGAIPGGYQFLDDKGNTPLSWAAYYGRSDLIMLFVNEFRFMINRQNLEGETALHFAIKGNSYDCVSALMELGADVNASNLKGESALHMAVCSGLEYVECLIENNVDVDAEDDFGETPLHWAVREDELQCVYVLLSGGANVNHPNEDGETPKMYADIFGSDEVKRLLLPNRVEGVEYNRYGTMPMAIDDDEDDEMDTPTFRSFSAEATLGYNPQNVPFTFYFSNEYH